MVKYDDLFELFFDKIENDKDFFQYNNISMENAMNIAKQRSERYLKEALSKLKLKCPPDKCGIDFLDIDDTEKHLNYEADYITQDMIASIMYERYMYRDFNKLKAQANRFTTKDLNVFSPAKERESFVTMFKQIQSDNDNLIDSYNSINHSTGNLITLKYSDLDE